MKKEPSFRSIIAAVVLVIALFLVVQAIVFSTSLDDLTLPLILGVIGVALIFWERFEGSEEREDIPMVSPAPVSMTPITEGDITPSFHEAGALAAQSEAVLPFMEGTASAAPETDETTEPLPEIPPLDVPETPATNSVIEPQHIDREEEDKGLEGLPPPPQEQIIPVAEDAGTPLRIDPPEDGTDAPDTTAVTEAAAEQVEAMIPEGGTTEQPNPDKPSEDVEVEINVPAEPVSEMPVLDTVVEDIEVPAEPVVTPTPQTGERKPDNLILIEGIGPKISGALIRAGMDTFEKLAVADVDQLRAILLHANVRVIGSVLESMKTWGHQATLAAQGKFEELKTWQVNNRFGK